MYSKAENISPRRPTAAPAVVYRGMHADIIRRVIFDKHEIGDSYQGKKLPEIYTVNSQNHQEPIESRNASNYSSNNPQGCIRPFETVLQILGFHPLVRDSHDKLYFKLLSSVTFYSIFMYLVICLSASYEVYRQFVSKAISDGDDRVQVYLLLRSTYFVEVMLAPIDMWLPFTQNARVQQKWIELDSCYVAMTQQPLCFKRLKKAAICYIVLMLVIGCIVTTYGFIVSGLLKESLWLHILYMIPFNASIMLDGYWAFTYILIGCTAHRITSSLKTQLQKSHLISGKKLAVIIRRHRIMWLQASQILQETNKNSASGIVSHVVIVFFMLTFSVYNVVINIIAFGFSLLILFGLVLVLFHLFQLSILANAANFTATKFQEIQWEPLCLIPPDEFDDDVRKEITLLLDVAAISPSTVNMRNYFVVNRSWLVNMISNLLSFIIILTQM